MKWIFGLIAVGALIGAGFYGKSVLQENAELKAENLLLETRLEIVQFNVELFERQLEAEREIRNAGAEAQTQLKQEVPDVDYNTPLPDSIQDVIDGFHGSVGLR